MASPPVELPNEDAEPALPPPVEPPPVESLEPPSDADAEAAPKSLPPKLTKPRAPSKPHAPHHHVPVRAPSKSSRSPSKPLARRPSKHSVGSGTPHKGRRHSQASTAPSEPDWEQFAPPPEGEPPSHDRVEPIVHEADRAWEAEGLDNQPPPPPPEVHSDLWRAARAQLNKWDKMTRSGHFSGEQAIELVRLLATRQAAVDPPCPAKPRKYVTFPCVFYTAFFAMLLLAAIQVAFEVAKDYSAADSGVLVDPSSGTPLAAGTAIRFHNLQDLAVLPPATLRRVRDCTFVHQGAVHHLSVASMVRSKDAQQVLLVGRDLSRLRLESRKAEKGAMRAYLSQPFKGEQELDITTEQLSHDGNTTKWLAGCSFEILVVAPERSRP